MACYWHDHQPGTHDYETTAVQQVQQAREYTATAAHLIQLLYDRNLMLGMLSYLEQLGLVPHHGHRSAILGHGNHVTVQLAVLIAGPVQVVQGDLAVVDVS